MMYMYIISWREEERERESEREKATEREKGIEREKESGGCYN